MKHTSKTNGTENKQVAVTLAKLNEQIATLQQQRAGLSEPLKIHFSELRKQLADTETQIRDLDPAWKPAPLKPKAQDKIKELVAANGGPLTETEIFKAVAGLFTKYKVRQTLKKHFTADAAGKYSPKP
jgi:hypothetical protein